MFWVQILPLPPHCFHFLNIVQYLYVHCTIPSILGSHPPYPTSPPTPNIVFTSTLTPPPHQPEIFFCEFFQKLQFFIHIHPDPPNPTPPPLTHPPSPSPDPTPPPPPPPNFFFLNFHKNFNSLFTSTLTPLHQPDPPHLT